jgi:DNA end-binding protein Ku
MARALAGATISFGLVSIPVKLYSATQAEAGVSFNMLHAKCGSRVKQQYICPRDNEIVSRDEMVKGYEFAKDQYVTFTPDELKALEEKATQTIEISEFVPLEKIDPVYFDKAYYLGPEKGGEKAYQLLAEAMRETGRSGLARYAARGKQYLVLLRPSAETGGGITMQQLLYSDEVRPFSEVPIPDAEVKESELKLAKQLIEQIASETFDPTQYHDDVRQRIEEDIRRKVDGQEIAVAGPEPEPARVIDLMEALKASLGGKRKGRGLDGGAQASAAGDDDAEPERRPARRATEKHEAKTDARAETKTDAKAEPKKKAARR